ncbi:MAG: PD40 domain-containing protein [Armatimonadetes bacterium]|nr:PD40 domain-containing protein [Armatimonadota bacterium]
MNRANQFSRLSSALTMLALCLASAHGSDAKIAFSSNRDDNAEIYVMNADGSGQARLTFHSASDSLSAFSPDGQRIAFSSWRDGNSEIYIMNADGTGQTPLTNHPAADAHPAFSPDGLKIAFRTDRDGNQEIYMLGKGNLTNDPSQDTYPAFSPDGKKIAFQSNRDGNFEVYVMNADGTDPIRLTNSTAFDGAPCYSPDGSKIAFRSERDGNAEIYVMNSDGTAQTRITNNTFFDTAPAFSPDGLKIAFTTYRDGNAEIYIMNADGTAQENLTNNPADDFEPRFPLFEATEVIPSSFTILRGLLLFGGLPELFDSDDSRLVVQTDVFSPSDAPPVQIEVTGTSPTETPSELRFRFEGIASRQFIQRRILLYNYVTQSYEELHVGFAATSDEVIEIVITSNPSRFVEPGTREVKSLMTWRAAAISFFTGWIVGIDQTIWRITR